MNKLYKSSLLLIPFILSGCNININISANPESNIKSDVFFTEFLVGNSADERAIEISNFSDETVSLDNYKVCIYKQNQKNVTYEIKLDDFKISGKSSFVISYSKSSDDLKRKSDFISNDLMINGIWSLSLNYKNQIVDVLGDIGYSTEYGKQVDLVRKNEYLHNKTTFDAFEWIKYRADDYSHLGNFDAGMSDEELLQGPRLTEEMKALPFVKEDGNGGGGFVEVDLAYVGDGDTTNFYFPSSLSKYGIDNRESIRYLRINTPEIQHGNSIDAQPWGQEAKKYNNNILNNAKKFIIQTEKDVAIRETYGRMLAYVWYANSDNPQLSDYKCLNCEMLNVGLATMYFSSDSPYVNPLLYKGISYASIFSNSEMYAKKLGIKIHGERDPNFNY